MIIIHKTNIVVKTKRRLAADGFDAGDEIILCPQCDEPMSDAQMAAEIIGSSVREIYRLVEAGEIHFFENEEKVCFMCLKSIGENAGL